MGQCAVHVVVAEELHEDLRELFCAAQLDYPVRQRDAATYKGMVRGPDTDRQYDGLFVCLDQGAIVHAQLSGRAIERAVPATPGGTDQPRPAIPARPAFHRVSRPEDLYRVQVPDTGGPICKRWNGVLGSDVN